MPEELRGVAIIPLANMPLIEEGDDLVSLIIGCIKSSGEALQDGDVLVLCQKIVSKSEGSIVSLKEVVPSREALELAGEVGKDPRIVQLILKESKRIVRKRPGVLIVEHKKGWVCADAGIDFSNVPGDCVTLFPEDPDRTAEDIRRRICALLGVEIVVLISDSQGRPFRNGAIGMALGCAGMPGVISKAGHEDLYGYKLRRTQIAFADLVASAAVMVMGETDEGVPAAIVRGLKYPPSDSTDIGLIRPEAEDMFR